MTNALPPASPVGPSTELGVSKNLLAIQFVARDLLTRVQGERIPTALQYQHLTGVGSGTVQKALRTLQHVGAVDLQSRGHTGTYLLNVELPKLWALAAVGAPTAVLPIPTSPELMGLARALRMEFKRLGIPFQALWTYGSSRRLALVEQGEADFTVLSATAATALLADRSDEWFASALSPNSYYLQGTWVVILRPGLDPSDHKTLRRIGIDRSSHDQTALTEAEFPLTGRRQYVDCNYTYMTAKVATGELDAMVWHRSVLTMPLEVAGITTRPLQQSRTVGLVQQMTIAMLVAKTSRPELARMFELLDRKSFSKVQIRLGTEEIPPFY